MRIHVDLTGIELHEQDECRKAAVEHHVAISQADRARDEAIAKHASIEIKMLQIRLCASERRLTQPAGQLASRRVGLDVHRIRNEFVADDLRYAALAFELRARLRILDRPPLADRERKGGVER